MSSLRIINIASIDQRLITADEPGPGDVDANAMETSDTLGTETLPTLKIQQASVDARKKKFIDIPMV